MNLLRAAALAAIMGTVVGCGSDPKTADSVDDPCGPADDVERGAVTAGEGVKTGVTTAVEGTKAVGKTVGGYVDGGSDEAKKEWAEGKADTRATANEGSSDTKTAANTKPCNR
ncbi:MAG: hypothetical protein WKG00_39580 [Polyangiaceae bacterium]